MALLAFLAATSLLLLRASAFWWYIGENASSTRDCHDLIKLKLTEEQKKECTNQRKLIRAISKGLHSGIGECGKQFAKKRWNCHTNKEYPNLFGNIVTKDTSETGFIYALMSASAVMGVINACSDGDIRLCGCRNMKNVPDPQPEWTWGGCSDDVENVVVDSTREFVDSPHRNRNDLSNMIKKHNNRAGYLAVRDNMKKICNCQGLSGSCTVKTCYLRIPRLHRLGATLTTKYKYAARVIDTVSTDSADTWILYDPHGASQPRAGDLVYSQSTDMQMFCAYNDAAGSVGTSGRVCNVTSTDSDSCNNMCCGRRFRETVRSEEFDCRCRFIYEELEMRCGLCSKNVRETLCT